MRHRKKVNHLGRKSEHRKAMLSNMASSLILHKRINTTLAKAKALKVFVEPLITKSKSDNTHSRRVVFSYLGNKFAVSELFREVAQKVADRPGGYTRILKTGFRTGDGAEMCLIELVDYNPAMFKKVEVDQTRKTRRAGRRKKTEGETEEAPISQTETSVQPGAKTDSPSDEPVEKKSKAKPKVKKTIESGSNLQTDEDQEQTDKKS
ncbi:MAG TPA: 50S ribosomal protein L17 [Bacteroidales bacterium]|nr:50S ribosomal protein L17 [Bacteroidales bacterium]